jgi:large subunit ribosomal protein L4
MISVDVVNRQGEKVGSVEVDPAEFGGAINQQLLHDVVVMYLANQRRGTHSTLRRGEVAGSTKKLFRQKGTGNARVGTRRTNKRKGGGTAKGPKPRDYEYHLPKKAVRAATRQAILSKLQDGEVVVIDDLKLEEVRTRDMAAVLDGILVGRTKARTPQDVPDKDAWLKAELKKEKKTFLIGTAGLSKDEQEKIYKSARNIPGVEVKPAAEFNAYCVLRPKRLLLTKAALEHLRNAGQKAEAQPTPA